MSGILKRPNATRRGVARVTRRARYNNISLANIFNICACARMCVYLYIDRSCRTYIYLPSFILPPDRKAILFNWPGLGTYDFRPCGSEGGTVGDEKNSHAHVLRRRHLPDKTYDKRVYTTGIYYYGICTGSEDVARI